MQVITSETLDFTSGDFSSKVSPRFVRSVIEALPASTSCYLTDSLGVKFTGRFRSGINYDGSTASWAQVEFGGVTVKGSPSDIKQAFAETDFLTTPESTVRKILRAAVEGNASVQRCNTASRTVVDVWSKYSDLWTTPADTVIDVLRRVRALYDSVTIKPIGTSFKYKTTATVDGENIDVSETLARQVSSEFAKVRLSADLKILNVSEVKYEADNSSELERLLNEVEVWRSLAILLAGA